ncbi:MAG: hypothetical protein OEZ22_14470 [Spirochaetia bacterium]|nr:hypothetical protein [Spirochaetia bacterium]
MKKDKLYNLKYLISYFFIFSIVFTYNCDKKKSKEDTPNNTIQIEENEENILKYVDAIIPEQIEPNKGWYGYNFSGFLVIVFSVEAGQAYSVKCDPDLDEGIYYNFNRLYSGDIIKTLVSPNGKHDYSNNLDPGAHVTFIAEETGEVSVILKVDDYALWTTGEELKHSLAVRVDSYNPIKGEILADSGWHEFDEEGYFLHQYIVPVTQNEIYTIFFSDNRKKIEWQDSGTYTGEIDIEVKSMSNTMVFKKDSYHELIEIMPATYVAQETGNLKIIIKSRISKGGSYAIKVDHDLPIVHEFPEEIFCITDYDQQIYNTNKVTYYSLYLTMNNHYQIYSYTHNIILDLFKPNGEKIMGFGSDTNFIASETGEYYLAFYPLSLNNRVCMSIKEQTSSSFEVDSGWQTFNITQETSYSVDVQQGYSYSISWDDFLEGSGTMTGDVVVTIEYEDGTIISENIENGYLTPLVFVADRNGGVRVILNPSTNGLVGLSVASTTPSPITIDSGWIQETSVSDDSNQIFHFDVTKGDVYSIKTKSKNYPIDEGYTGNISIKAYYADINNEYRNYMFANGDVILYLMGQIFSAKKTGKVFLEVSSTAGSYALRVDSVTPERFNVNTGWQTINIDSSKVFSFDINSDNFYTILWEDSKGTNGYTSRAYLHGYDLSGFHLFGTTASVESYSPSIDYNTTTDYYNAWYLPVSNQEINFIISPNQTYLYRDDIERNIGYGGTLGVSIESNPIINLQADGTVQNIPIHLTSFSSFEVEQNRYYKIKNKTARDLSFEIFSSIDGSLIIDFGLLDTNNFGVFKATSNTKVYLKVKERTTYDPLSYFSCIITKY